MARVAPFVDDPRVSGETCTKRAYKEHCRAEAFILEMEASGNSIFKRGTMQDRDVQVEALKVQVDQGSHEVVRRELVVRLIVLERFDNPLTRWAKTK